MGIAICLIFGFGLRAARLFKLKTTSEFAENKLFPFVNINWDIYVAYQLNFDKHLNKVTSRSLSRGNLGPFYPFWSQSSCIIHKYARVEISSLEIRRKRSLMNLPRRVNHLTDLTSTTISISKLPEFGQFVAESERMFMLILYFRFGNNCIK